MLNQLLNSLPLKIPGTYSSTTSMRGDEIYVQEHAPKAGRVQWKQVQYSTVKMNVEPMAKP